MFSKALFYPTIDIKDEDWLKSAYLFWDEIDTIVPESMAGCSYNNYTTQYLEGEGFLKPILISPDHDVVKDIVKDIKGFALTKDGLAFLTQKLPNGVSSDPYCDERSQFYLHHEKLPYEIQDLVADRIDEDGWARVSDNFASYYMTLLANKIASQKSLALLTDSSPLECLSTKVTVKGDCQDFSVATRRNEALGRCVLMKLIIEGISLNPLTSIDDLRIFKEHHLNELINFRNAMAEMSRMELPPDITVEGIEQRARDIYNHKVLFAHRELQKSLKGAGIKFIVDSAATIAVTNFSTVFNDALENMSVPVYLALGAGASLTYHGYNYYKNIGLARKNNSMSYLLSIDRELGHEY